MLIGNEDSGLPSMPHTAYSEIRATSKGKRMRHLNGSPKCVTVTIMSMSNRTPESVGYPALCLQESFHRSQMLPTPKSCPAYQGVLSTTRTSQQEMLRTEKHSN